MNFNTWLEQELNSRGWTQSELARRANNLSQAYVSAILSGKRQPTWDFCNNVWRWLLVTPLLMYFRLLAYFPIIVH